MRLLTYATRARPDALRVGAMLDERVLDLQAAEAAWAENRRSTAVIPPTMKGLLRLETAIPWMGLVSALLMAGFGVLLISGNYMVVSEWTYRLVGGGAAALPALPSGLLLAGAAAMSLGIVAWLAWMAVNGKGRRVARSAGA